MVRYKLDRYRKMMISNEKGEIMRSRARVSATKSQTIGLNDLDRRIKMSELTKRMARLDGCYRALMGEVEELAIQAQHSIECMTSQFILRRFDELVQYILLCTASSTGAYKELDHKLVRGISLYGDLLETYNDIAEADADSVPMDWEALFHVINANGKDGVVAGLASFAELLYDRTTFVIKAIAPISCMHYHDYFEEMLANFYETVEAFIDATTADEDRETRHTKGKMARTMIESMFIKPWLAECDGYCNEKFLSDKAPAKRAHAVKERFDALDILYRGDD